MAQMIKQLPSSNPTITNPPKKTSFSVILKKSSKARCQWLTLVILATYEAEIRRITVPSTAQAKSS
jgi:hypothetical protein